MKQATYFKWKTHTSQLLCHKERHFWIPGTFYHHKKLATSEVFVLYPISATFSASMNASSLCYLQGCVTWGLILWSVTAQNKITAPTEQGWTFNGQIIRTYFWSLAVIKSATLSFGLCVYFLTPVLFLRDVRKPANFIHSWLVNWLELWLKRV